MNCNKSTIIITIILLYTVPGLPPGSPGPFSMPGLSIASPSSSPQLEPPGHLPAMHHHFPFTPSTNLSSSESPIAVPTPSSPSNIFPSQPPPPLPPRSHRRRESSISESSLQVRIRDTKPRFNVTNS